MIKLSAAQQIVSQFVPNIADQATDLIQAFKGGISSGAGGNTSLFDGQSVFDAQLNQASSAEKISFDRRDNDRRVDLTNTPKREDLRNDYDRPYRAEESRDRDHYRDDYIEPKEAIAPAKSDEKVDTQAKQSDESESITRENKVGSAESNTKLDSKQTAEEVSAEEPIGSAGELVEQAKALLEKLEALQAANPELAAELQAILAPIQDVLQKIVAQLSALNADASIKATALEGDPSAALAQLKQLAGLFGDLQQAGSLKKLGQQLAGQDIPEDFAKALKALQQVDKATLTKVNQLVESFRQLVTPAAADPASQVADTVKSQVASGQPSSVLQTAVAANLNQDAGAQAKGELATTEARLNGNSASVAAGNQPSNQGDTGNGQQGQGFANGQAQALAQKSGAATKLDAGSQTTSTGSQSSTQTSGSANASTTTSATLTKEAANFEQILKQANRPAVAEQIQVKMKAMIKNGQSKISVKLDPVELGKVEIKMEINRASKTQVVVSVERPQTLELLQRDSRILMQALQDAGLKADGGSLSFNLQGGNDSSGGQGQQPKNVYPIAEEQFDEEMLSVVSENYTLEVEQGVNIHA